MKRFYVPILLIPLIVILLFAPLQAEETRYTCPMHPHYISEIMGTCPICGMNLVPIQVESRSDETGGAGKVLQLSSQLVQTTGVRSEKAEIAYFGRVIRSFGEVVANRRLQTDISLRTEGWVEELIVDAPGDKVEAGDVLFRLYSPELISAQQNYISALSQKNRERINITRNRLSSLGVQDSAIELVAQKGTIIRAVPFFASQGGRVEVLKIRKGSYLRPGDIALRIQSYNTVWVDVSLAEQDISFVNISSQVKVVLPSLGLQLDKVAIDYISPTVDPKTRTAKLRLLIENPKGNIRPGAYADVEISTDIRPRLSIAYESVLQNKQGSYVIVEVEKGGFQARQVVLGLESKGRVEVRTGLKEGETIVTSGQFLIDSESSLRESFSKMEKMAASLAQMELSPEQMVLLNHIVETGIYIHGKLVAKELPVADVVGVGAQAAAKLLAEVEGTRLSYIIKDTQNILADTEGIITMSDWRELLATLMETLRPWIVEGRPGYYSDLGLTIFLTDSGRLWLQFAGEGENPYAVGAFREVALATPEQKLEVQDGQ